MTLFTGRLLKRGQSLSRGTPLKRRGARSDAWQKFRDEQFQKDMDEEELIRCEDWKIGLKRCGIARNQMDLHHVEGRDGKLLLDRSKMVWLTRECHEIAHNR